VFDTLTPGLIRRVTVQLIWEPHNWLRMCFIKPRWS